jgi:hypothetical protein
MNNQSLVRRSFAVVVATVLAVAFAVVGTAPASAAVKGYLRIVSIADDDNPQDGLADEDRPFDIVKDRPSDRQFFNVVVEVRDAPQNPNTSGIDGQLTTLTRATEVVLEEVSGPGALGGTIRATILRDRSGTTISGATYSEYANGVEFRVVGGRGVELAPSADFSVNVALTARSEVVPPGDSLDLTDPNCGAPTSTNTTCGRLILPADGSEERPVLMSVGSCEGLANCRPGAGGATALVVTAVFPGEFDKETPATLVLACDKVICGQSGAGPPQIPIIYTFLNGGTLNRQTNDPCPEKGVLGDNQEICVDYVQSSRNQGDLYTYILFDHDLRASHP